MPRHTFSARAIGRWQRLRRQGAQESGVVLVIVAVLMTAFLGLAAVAIDLGSYYQSQSQAQSAADAAALAASQNLPTNTTNAKSAATTYATTNYPGATVTVTTPYNSNASQVKVTVNAASPSFFGKYFGRTSANVSASAVAAAGAAGGAKTAIFAKSATCGNTLYLQQGSMTLVGGVHSNGGIRTSGHGNTYSSGTYGGPNGCSYQDDSGGSNVFGGTTSPTVDSTNQPWPEDFTDDFPTLPLNTTNDPNCTFWGTDLNLQVANQSLVAGTRCYQTIEFNAPGITCTCTFVASQSIQFNQGPDNFTPSYQDLQFYDMDSGNVNLNANGTSFLATSAASGGTLFAPNASLLTVNAPSGTVWGAIESNNVVVNGGGPTTWNGTGTPIGGNSTPPSLVQ